MKKFGYALALIIFLSIAFFLSGLSPVELPQEPGEGPIIHTVMFSLSYPPDSDESENFLSDGKKILTSIPGVKNFEVRRQISTKNDYQYGFSMHFNDKTSFEDYLNHPLHTKFVSERWEKEVTSFLEADYTAIPKD